MAVHHSEEPHRDIRCWLGSDTRPSDSLYHTITSLAPYMTASHLHACQHGTLCKVLRYFAYQYEYLLTSIIRYSLTLRPAADVQPNVTLGAHGIKLGGESHAGLETKPHRLQNELTSLVLYNIMWYSITKSLFIMVGPPHSFECH